MLRTAPILLNVQKFRTSMPSMAQVAASPGQPPDLVRKWEGCPPQIALALSHVPAPRTADIESKVLHRCFAQWSHIVALNQWRKPDTKQSLDSRRRCLDTSPAQASGHWTRNDSLWFFATVRSLSPETRSRSWAFFPPQGRKEGLSPHKVSFRSSSKRRAL